MNRMAAVSPLSKKKSNPCPAGATQWVAPFFISMDQRFALRRGLLGAALALVSLSACSPAATSTPFRPPTAPAPLIEPTLIIHPTQKPAIVVQATPATPLPTVVATIDPRDCTNNLDFIEDVTVRDDTVMTPGTVFDKQWLVQNNGTCNWNAAYRLKHVGGGLLGAAEEMALYRARAGTQATLQIRFTAPFTASTYESAWQAADANGTPFGDVIYIRILVQ